MSRTDSDKVQTRAQTRTSNKSKQIKISIEDPILTRTPNSRIFLLRISVCNQVSDGNFYLGEPGRSKNCSHCNFQDLCSPSKEDQVSLLRIFFSDPESDGKSLDVGVGGRIRILINIGIHGTRKESKHDSSNVRVKVRLTFCQREPGTASKQTPSLRKQR